LPAASDHRKRDLTPVILEAQGPGGEPDPMLPRPPGLEAREPHPSSLAQTSLRLRPVVEQGCGVGDPASHSLEFSAHQGATSCFSWFQHVRSA
jgi:hypothetical protein